MSSIGPVNKVTPWVAAGAVLGTAALVLAIAASANLPKKPACSDVSYSMIESAFGVTPIGTGGGVNKLPGPPGLTCLYYRSTGHPTSGISIEYDYPTTTSAYKSYLKEFKKVAPPVRRVGGIGDAAFIAGSGKALVFLDGTYVVTIKNGTLGPQNPMGSAAVAAIEAFAKEIIPLT